MPRSGRPRFGPADGIITNDVSITASPRWQITARESPLCAKTTRPQAPILRALLKSPVGAVSLLSPAAPSVADVVAVVRPTKTRAPANGVREPDLSSLFAAI